MRIWRNEISVTVQPSRGDFIAPADFQETPMPSVSFCLFAHPIRLSISIYFSDPPRANKQKIDACLSSNSGDAHHLAYLPAAMLHVLALA